MAKVTDIGGVFFKAKGDTKAFSAWYPQHLGLVLKDFGCEDCAVPLARAAAQGGSVFQDKTPIGEHGFCAIAKDSEGNLIGFHSMA